MSVCDDINKLIERLRATFFGERDFSLHDVRDAANALEALAAECDFVRSSMWSAVAERDRLKDEVERLRNEKAVVGAGSQIIGKGADQFIIDDPFGPPTDPAPAVCGWDSRTTVFPMPTCTPAAALLNRIHRDGDMCPLCGKPIKFAEAKVTDYVGGHDVQR